MTSPRRFGMLCETCFFTKVYCRLFVRRRDWQKGPKPGSHPGPSKHLQCFLTSKISTMVLTTDCHYSWVLLPLSVVADGTPSPGVWFRGPRPMSMNQLETSHLSLQDGSQLLDSGRLGRQEIFRPGHPTLPRLFFILREVSYNQSPQNLVA